MKNILLLDHFLIILKLNTLSDCFLIVKFIVDDRISKIIILFDSNSTFRKKKSYLIRFFH